MTPVAIGILALSLSVDAFVAALGRSAGAGDGGGDRIRVGPALRTGAVFGLIEALTPVVGWTLGIAASRYIEVVDHWIAFALLGFVGGRMILGALEARDTAPAAQTGRRSAMALIATALGTSVDAMAVGVSLAFADVSIWVVALAVGLTTTAMATLGQLAGRHLGLRFGRIAEAAGGLALIVMGLAILLAHLNAESGLL